MLPFSPDKKLPKITPAIIFCAIWRAFGALRGPRGSQERFNPRPGCERVLARHTATPAALPACRGGKIDFSCFHRFAPAVGARGDPCAMKNLLRPFSVSLWRNRGQLTIMMPYFAEAVCMPSLDDRPDLRDGLSDPSAVGQIRRHAWQALFRVTPNVV